MSLKYRAELHGTNHYVLPRIGTMRCDVHAFMSPELYTISDEGTWQQAFDAASYPNVRGVYLMPDCHLGYGIPVGGVVVTDGVIIQSGSGYDISCGVIYMRLPGVTAADVVDWERRLRWVREVELRVATGVGRHRPKLAPKITGRMIAEVLLHGAKPLGVSADVCERQFIQVDEKHFDSQRVERAIERAGDQLGSVGGGNHFIELQVDRDTGEVWAMVHCGSRGFGWQTANHFFFAGAEARGLPKNRRESSWLYADEEVGKQYWAHHNAAANYAIANRHMIVEGVREATQEVFAASPEVYFEISHNLVQDERVLVPGADGSYEFVRGFVHRKGATRAFPAHHPDLVGTKWEETGHPCLIPGSMLDGAAILFPTFRTVESGFSVNHGSGRAVARGQAKRDLEPLQEDIDTEMRTIRRTVGPDRVEIVGIVGNTAKTPLDECGHVYKKLDQVVGSLVDAGVATVSARLYPVANLKGTD